MMFKPFSLVFILYPFCRVSRLRELNENFTKNFLSVETVEKVFVDTVAQEYNIQKSGYYLIVSACRVFGVNEGSFPKVISSYAVGTSDINGDSVAGETYPSEYAWITLVSIEKMNAGKRKKFFRIHEINCDNFDVRTKLYWLGKS